MNHMLNELPDVTELLMHRPPMLLIDYVNTFDAESVVMSYIPHPQAWYADAEGNMPAWIGIELMAQAIGCHVGLNKRLERQPPKQGVLLGTRRYSSNISVFPQNRQLSIKAALIFRDESGLAAYDCEISQGGTVLASATLKVFEPDNFQQFLQGAGS